VCSRPLSLHSTSVSQDWRKPLIGDKSDAYAHCLRRLETSYHMFSVNLDEAFEMRRTGRNSKACQVLSVSPALCGRLAHPLRSLLQVMLDHVKHFGIVPNLAPLDPQNFQNPRSRRAALLNDLLSRILFTRKSQFFHKISTLADLVDQLDLSFQATATELVSGESPLPDHDWESLDATHYDLNTCLREAVVLLKSFLHALPEAQMIAFQSALNESCTVSRSPLVGAERHLAHRRIAFLKGQ
jgi:hypothetical protein